MRIVQANAVFDPAVRTPAALLDLYRTLTEWSAAVAQAGATVSVVQRFSTASTLERDGISYQFTTDSRPPWLSTKDAPQPFIDAIASQQPDVVHINGLIFPQLVAGIRNAVGRRTAIVVQHHGGEFPIRGSGLVGMWRRRRWLGGLQAADAISFTAREQAEPWQAAGVLGDRTIIEIIEASTTLRTISRERARTALGVTGNPLILWVGRLTTNKDPLSVLDGLEIALPKLPEARVVMVFGEETLFEDVDARVRRSQVLAERVTLAGRVAHDEMPNYYGAADVFVSGSHAEGSGYALIEALSAGLVPVVTDIPPFQRIAGPCGRRWQPGDGAAMARALMEVAGAGLESQRAASIAQFEHALSWPALAGQTVREYGALLESRRSAG